MPFPFLNPNDFNFLQGGTDLPVNSLFQPPQGNPYEALDTILNNLNNQPLAQAPPQSLADRIIQGIVSAASVASSRDPGEALGNLIKSKQAERVATTEALRNRQNFVNQAKVQVGFEQARSLAEQQSKIAEENRANFREIAKEKRATQAQIATEKRALGNYTAQKTTDLDIAKQEFEQNEELLNKYAPLREARMRHEMLIKDIPEQMQRSAAWQSIAELTEAGS